ncbi:metallopeptidase domain-containing protein [Streptomyces sp. NPDC093676]|uniref:hypothetical protein n=1 Tax=Streptomyces sp. NPDC093676 TaxID=3366050 RepID=UPI0037FB715C
MWKQDVGADEAKTFDRAMRIYAGYDETSVWQEFGEMKFQTPQDVPDEWGPPDPDLPNAVRSRYTGFTSWKAGSQLWGNSGIRQGESSGTITHEITHTFGIGDNNNPYVEPYHRAGTGPFDVLDRGSFNGPGGPRTGMRTSTGSPRRPRERGGGPRFPMLWPPPRSANAPRSTSPWLPARARRTTPR